MAWASFVKTCHRHLNAHLQTVVEHILYFGLPCPVSLSRPQQVNWVKVDDDVPSHAVITGTDLYIENLNKSYNGTYRCVASNLLGESYDDYILYVYGEYIT